MLTADIYYVLFSKQLIFFVAGIFVSSCIYGLTLTRDPKTLLHMYTLHPQDSFTALANSHHNGTYTMSYSSHKRQMRIMKLWAGVSIGFLILTLLLAFV